MSNEPRVYRQSSLQVILMIVAFSVLGIGLVISMAFVEFQYLLLALGVLGVTFTIALYSQTEEQQAGLGRVAAVDRDQPVNGQRQRHQTA